MKLSCRSKYMKYNELANGIGFFLDSSNYKLTHIYLIIIYHESCSLLMKFGPLFPWGLHGNSSMPSSLYLYLSSDFQSSFTLQSHWFKQFYSSINKNNTYARGHPTSPFHKLYILKCFMELPQLLWQNKYFFLQEYGFRGTMEECCEIYCHSY